MGLTNASARAGSNWKYTGAAPVITGSAARRRRGVRSAAASLQGKFLIGCPAYLRHMGLVARDELGIDPRTLGVKALILHLGLEDRQPLQELRGPTRSTLTAATNAAQWPRTQRQIGDDLFEDAFVMEVNDLETLKPKPPGERGVIFITTLFKHAAPMIRYNMNDVTSWARAPARGTQQRSISKIFGRSDNMVKLRGVNVFPEAIGGIVSANPRCNGEYVCVLEGASGGREDMTVMVEARDDSVSKPALEGELALRLKELLGVKISVRMVGGGELDHLTGLSQTSKIKRLIDKRAKDI